MNERIVSNTGPLIALALVDQLEILSKLYGEILVPEAVHRELLQGGELFAMAGGTPNHNRITMDLAEMLNAALGEYNSLDDALYIQALQCRLFLKDVYRRVTPLPAFRLMRPKESDGEERDNA